MLKNLFGQSNFFKNTAILVMGTSIAQAIPIFLQPILRRVYSPEVFGAFAVYFSMIGILTVIANFRYELAIGLPKSDEDGANVFFLTLFLNFFFNIFLFLIILFFRNNIAYLFKFPDKFSGFLFLLPLSTFLFCSFQSMNYWLIRKKAFRSLSVNKISRRGAEGVVQVVFGLFRNPSGLFWADAVGSLSNNISGISQLRKTDFRYQYFSKEKALVLMRRYIHYPKFNLLPALIGTLAMQFPVFIINRLFTKTELGFFDLTQQAILAPFALISVAVSQVLLQVVTEKKHKREKIYHDFIKLSLLLLALGLVSVVVIELWGPELFAFVFGKKCLIAGLYSRILIIGYVFFLVASPMGAILMGLEEIRVMSLWNLIHFILIVGLYFVKDITFINFLKIFVGIEIVAFTIYYVLINKALIKYEKQLLDPKADSHE
jgi:O-antigen/teichoic acid export membrane protein